MTASCSWQTAKRLISSVPVHYGPYRVSLFEGYSVDISLGGLYLKTELPLNLNEHISLDITLPESNDVVSCEARVAWVNSALAPRKPQLPPGVGVEFVNLSSNVALEIKRFIDRREYPESKQAGDHVEEVADREKICDLHSSCAFYARYKGQSYGSQYHYFCNSYCQGALVSRCKRRLMVKTRGINPPDNMSPTGHLIII